MQMIRVSIMKWLCIKTTDFMRDSKTRIQALFQKFLMECFLVSHKQYEI